MSGIADVCYAVRSLAKSPGFAMVALLTVALGVGANTAVFSVVNATLLRPLPFADSDRLVAIHEVDRRTPGEHRDLSYPNFVDWQGAMTTVESMAAYSAYMFITEVGDTARPIEAARVSANYFDVLGVAPLRGRSLMPDDDDPAAAPVIVIDETLWSELFNRDPQVIGRALTINDTAATIVGVMPKTAAPPDMTGLQDLAQIWAPMGRFFPPSSLRARGSPFITPVIARLRPGTTMQDAQREIDRVAAALEQQYPTNRNRGASVVSFADQYFRQARSMLFILLGAVGFVLAIACANLASLLLARGDARQRELAVRAALGATRARIVRLVFAESLVVAACGGALGLLAAAWFIDLLVALSPASSLPSFVHVAIDGRVLLFTLAVCATSGLAFGLAPAITGSRAEVVEALKAGGRGGPGGSPSLRRRLVTVQIAVALMLVVGAGLMLRTLERLRAFDPGFDLDGLVAAVIRLPASALGNTAEPRTHEQLRAIIERVRSLPGVESAALTWDLPLNDTWLQTRVRLVDREADPVPVRRHPVGPGYFRTMRIPLVEGRDFTASDTRAAGHDVAIISRRMAERHWPNASALHQQIAINDRTLEIVGVVGDVQHERLLQPSTADPDVYYPLQQATLLRAVTVALRTTDARRAMPAVREIVRNAGNGMSVLRTRTGDEMYAAQTVRQRFVAMLLTLFSAVAIVVTLVGVYGVAAYNVSRQTREIGVRMALGATRRNVLRTILRAEMPSVAVGITFGMVAALALGGTLSGLLHGVSAADPVTFAAVAVLIGLVAAFACLVPARTATRVDPVVALRAE